MLTVQQKELVEKNIGLAYFFILKYKNCLFYQEILSESFFNLIKTVLDYDQNKGSLSTYAGFSIVLRNNHFLNREKAYEERNISANQIIFESENGFAELQDIISDKKPSVEEILITKQRKKVVRRVLDQLPEKEKKIIELYFGFNDNPLSMPKIAIKYGLTRQAINNRLKKSLAKLKTNSSLSEI